MKRAKVGGVRLLLLVAATLILVAQVSAEPVATELSDGNVRDQILKHEQYAAHVSNAIQSQSSETVKIAERERYAAQIGVKSKDETDSEDQDLEIASIRERLHAINEKLANGDLSEDEIAELRRIKYALEQKLNELMGTTVRQYASNSATATPVSDTVTSEIASIRERLHTIDEKLANGDLSEDEMAELRRMKYALEQKLNELMNGNSDEPGNSVDDENYSEIASIRERLHTIDEKLANGDLSEDEIAELRRMKYALEQRLNELMNGNSGNTDGSSDSQASDIDTNDETDNRSGMAGSIREIIRSFFGI